jgi:predicted RNA-binding Zn-ribbon protein involved in translation (DUF1610 family)
MMPNHTNFTVVHWTADAPESLKCPNCGGRLFMCEQPINHGGKYLCHCSTQGSGNTTLFRHYTDAELALIDYQI